MKPSDGRDIRDFATREEWVAARRGSIGGSDAPSLYNAGYLSQLELQLTKLGELGPQPASLPMKMGLLAEPLIAEVAEEHTQLVAVSPGKQVMYRRFDAPFLHATPDRFLLKHRPERVHSDTLARKSEALLSLKLVSPFLRDAWTDIPPVYALIQLQQEMIVTGVKQGYIAAVFGNGHDSTVYGPISLDPVFSEQHIERCKRWWERHIVQRLPITADLFDPDDSKLLNLIFPTSQPKTAIILGEKWVPIQRRLAKLKRVGKRIEAEEKRIEAMAKAALGENEYGLIDNESSFSWITAPRIEAAREARKTEVRTFRMVKTPKELRPLLTAAGPTPAIKEGDGR